MTELILAILEAAVIEARLMPRMLMRDGDLYWRANGRMVRLTAGPVR